jgi:hypothetical protein
MNAAATIRRLSMTFALLLSADEPAPASKMTRRQSTRTQKLGMLAPEVVKGGLSLNEIAMKAHERAPPRE